MEHLIGASGTTPGATADVDFEARVEAAFAEKPAAPLATNMAFCGAISPFHRLAIACQRPVGHDQEGSDSPTYAHNDGHSTWLDNAQMAVFRTAPEEELDDLGDAIQAELDKLPATPAAAAQVYRDSFQAYQRAVSASKARAAYLDPAIQETAARLDGVTSVFIALGWEIPR